MARKTPKYIIFTLALVLLVGIMAGCKVKQVEGVTYQQPSKNTITFEISGDTWKREIAGRTATIYRGSEQIATVSGGRLEMPLEGGAVMTVYTDKTGAPATVSLPFGTAVTPEMYDTAETACEVQRLALVVMGNPAGTIIFMLLFLAAGILLLVFAGKLAKLLAKNADPADKRMRNALLIAGGVLTLVGVILLLVLIF